METASGVSDIHKVVMYGSCFDEGTLAARNNSIHLRTEPASHSFSDNLRDHVDEAYWPEIRDGFRTVLLWNEDDVSCVEDGEIRS